MASGEKARPAGSLRRADVLELLASILDRELCGIAVLEPLEDASDLRIVFANAPFQALRPSRPMLGRLFSEIWPELAASAVPRSIEVLATGAPWVTLDLSPDEPPGAGVPAGKRHAFEVARITAGDGALLLVAAAETGEPVTDPTLQEALERMTDGMLVLDTEYRCTFITEQGARIVSRTPAQVIGKKLWEEFPEADAFMARYRHVTETQEPERFVEEYAPLGLWLETRVYPSPTGLTVFFLDVTEQHDAQRGVELERERLQTLLDVLPVAVFIGDAAGGIVYTNQAATELWGPLPTTDRVDEYGAYRGWWPDTGKRLKAREWAAARALAGETVIGEVVNIERFDGRRATILNSAVPIRDERGGITGMVNVAQDITERRKQEEQAQRSEERFKLLSEANSLLLSAADPEATIQLIAEKVMRHLGADVFFNYALEPGTDRLRLNASGGVRERVAKMVERLELGQAICGCVARDGERIISVDVQHNGDPRAELVRRMGVRCYVCHPLQAGDATVGTLSFGTKSKDCFDDDEIELMRIVANQISIAMRRVRSEGEARRELANTLVLEAAAEAAATSTSLERIASNVLDALVEHMDLHMGTLFVHDETANAMELLSQRGLSPKYADRIRRLPIAAEGPTLVSIAAAQKRIVTSSQVPMTTERLELLRGGGLHETQNIAVPILVQDRLAGVLSFVFERERDFTADERDLFTSLARILSQAFENARLFEAEVARSRRERVLKEILAAATASLVLGETGRLVVDRLQEELGGASVMILVADTRDGMLDVLAYAGYDPALVEEMTPVPLDAQTETVEAFRTGAPRYVADVVEAAATPETRRLAELQSLRSAANVPLSLHGAPVGVLALAWPEPRSFTDEEKSFLESLASEVALGISNARAYQSEHAIADRLQEALLALPESIPGIEFAASYHSATEAARVGGDFYDLFEIEHGLVGITMGDVAGKGLDAAVLTSLVKNTIRAHATSADSSPSSILTLANDVIQKATATEAFVTVFFGILDVERGKLAYASAGHTTGAVVHIGGGVEALPATGPLLGAFGGVTFGRREAPVGAGELLFLYTDGLTEARRDGEQYGEQRLMAVLSAARDTRPARMVRKITRDVMSFAGGRIRDDVALLAVRRAEPAAPAGE